RGEGGRGGGRSPGQGDTRTGARGRGESIQSPQHAMALPELPRCALPLQLPWGLARNVRYHGELPGPRNHHEAGRLLYERIPARSLKPGRISWSASGAPALKRPGRFAAGESIGGGSPQEPE